MELFAIVPSTLAGERLDRGATVLFPELSRSAVQLFCSEGRLLLNNKPAAKSTQLKEGDTLAASVPEPQTLEALPEEIPLDIVYEDADLLVVNKPKGMVVHPAAGNYTGTLVNALLSHCGDSLSGINGVIRPGIVHRIDKDTTGLLIVAKNDMAHKGLSEQIKEHSFVREYAAIVHGRLKQQSFTIDAPIGRSTDNRKKMCITEKNSRNAITHVELLEELNGFSYIKCVLETGRTHQIRVHMAYIGHPVAGDPVYGPKKAVITGSTGQCLHARTIGFVHPRTGENLFFTSPLPKYFEDFKNKLAR